MKPIPRRFVVMTLAAAPFLTACLRLASREPLPLPPPPAADSPSALDVATMPSFVLPAPTPSTRAILNRAVKIAPEDTLGTVADRLEGLLDAGGYAEFSYFQVPNGFAIATRMERIYPDGTPYSGDARWYVDPTGLINWKSGITIDILLDGIRRADPGHYRIIVFVVTNRTLSFSSGGMRSDVARRLVTIGASALPASYSNTKVGPGSVATALIYEFNRASVGADAKLSMPSDVPASLQLRRTGILP